MTKSIITPFHDNVLLEEIPPKKEIGSIIIPEAHQSKLNQGTVVDKGPTCSENIQIGNILFFTMHSESRLEYKGHKFIVVSEANCLGSIQSIESND